MTDTKKDNASDLKERIDEVGKRFTANSPQLDATFMEPMSDPVSKQLVMFPEEAAAMPTELTRVALFGLPGDRRGARKRMESVLLDGRSDVNVVYTGDQLSAKDETAWLACLRIGRGKPMGDRVYLNKADLLREVGLKNSGTNWLTMENRLMRLSKAHFVVNMKRTGREYKITSGLLKWGIEEISGEMFIRLDPDGARLFENLAYQPWQVRLSLHTDVAARILSYVSGHKVGKPHSVLLDDLRRWCGYSGPLRKFRASCIASLRELEEKGVLVAGSSDIKDGANEVACWIRTMTTPE